MLSEELAKTFVRLPIKADQYYGVFSKSAEYGLFEFPNRMMGIMQVGDQVDLFAKGDDLRDDTFIMFTFYSLFHAKVVRRVVLSVGDLTSIRMWWHRKTDRPMQISFSAEFLFWLMCFVADQKNLPLCKCGRRVTCGLDIDRERSIDPFARIMYDTAISQ